MNKIISIEYKELSNISELTKDQYDLVIRAYLACDSAYAPYSKFHVGAAILLENKHIVIGFNQENASYPCGICAERVALYSTATQFPRAKIKSIAISTSKLSLDKMPSAPCGLCRQVLSEFEISNEIPIELILAHPEGKVLVFESCNQILPFCFTPKSLQ